MIYVILKIIFPCLWVIRLVDSNKAGMYKVFYYARMTKISIIKSSSDIDNKEIFPVSGSSSQKVWISSHSDTEEEENIGTDYPESIYSEMLENLSLSVCKLWQKRQLDSNTNFEVTGCMLCVIPHIRKYAKDHSDSDHRKQVNNVIKIIFSGAFEEAMSVNITSSTSDLQLHVILTWEYK